jgi:excisionase family DNA binding protein
LSHESPRSRLRADRGGVDQDRRDGVLIFGVGAVNKFGQKKGKDGEAGRVERAMVPLAERLSLSPEEASALTGIGLTSIREAIRSGHLKAKKLGRRVMILMDDLKAWLKALPGSGEQLEESAA